MKPEEKIAELEDLLETRNTELNRTNYCYLIARKSAYGCLELIKIYRNRITELESRILKFKKINSDI